MSRIPNRETSVARLQLLSPYPLSSSSAFSKHSRHMTCLFSYSHSLSVIPFSYSFCENLFHPKIRADAHQIVKIVNLGGRDGVDEKGILISYPL